MKGTISLEGKRLLKADVSQGEESVSNVNSRMMANRGIKRNEEDGLMEDERVV